MGISFYILRSFCLSKIVLLGVLLFFSCFVYSQQTQTISLSGVLSYGRTVSYCSPEDDCTGGFGILYCPSNPVNLNTKDGVRYAVLNVPAAGGTHCSEASSILDSIPVPDDFVVNSYSCNLSISGSGNTANITCASSGIATEVGMGDGFFTSGSCDYDGKEGGRRDCDNSCHSFVSAVNCSVTGTSNKTPPLPKCSNFIPVSDGRCKGGQGLRLQTDGAVALYNIKTAFGEVSPVGNSSSYFQTLSGAVFLEYSSNNQTLLPDTVMRSDGSKCVNNVHGNSSNYLVCPFGFEMLPEDTTSYNSCPAETAPMALRKIIQDRKGEKETAPDYALPWESQPYYDALGRKTQDNPNTRRYLFEKNKNKSPVREIEPETKGFLLRDNASDRKCCVKSFNVGLRDSIWNNSIYNNIIDGKVGIKVGFNAKFHGEGYEAGCDPSCCEFKQDVMGLISRNDTILEGTTCKIGGTPVFLHPYRYVEDCYGRGCNNSFESYDDALGIYKGTDFPGLNNVTPDDDVDIFMEFNSHIKDWCNANEIKETRSWGFHMYGNIDDNDSLSYTLTGEINQ